MKRIIASIKEGTFFEKVKRRIVRPHIIHYEYARTIEKRDRVYKKMQKKYHHILERPMEKSCESEKSNYVWICWFQGIENAPPLVKACVKSIREKMPDKEIVILTEETIPKYVTFPEYIVEKRKRGQIGAAHYSDLLRIELLCQYGGLWIDSTVLCTSDKLPDYIMDAPLFVYKQMDLSRHNETSIQASNWLIQAQKGSAILELTRELLYEYWKDYNDCIDYFIFHIFFAMAVKRYPEEWNQIPVFNNHSPHVLQFELDKDYSEKRWEQITRMSVFHKLNRYHTFKDKPDSFYMHILRMYEED